MDLPRSSFAAQDAFMKADQVINDMGYSKIAVSVSGGSDSDVVVDIIHKVDRDKKCTYRYFDTGMEYQATYDHLDYLEQRYCITIERVEPVERVAVACKKHGLPVFSKHISQIIGMLQGVGFEFKDEPEDVLLKRYGDAGIMRAIKWWTNGYNYNGARPSKFTIAHKRWLKEYMIENPPDFPISDKCCTYAKKLTAQRAHEQDGYDVDIIGVRQAEGGGTSQQVHHLFFASKQRERLTWLCGLPSRVVVYRRRQGRLHQRTRHSQFRVLHKVRLYPYWLRLMPLCWEKPGKRKGSCCHV